MTATTPSRPPSRPTRAEGDRRGPGLQWKLTAALVVIVMVPLGASALLVDQIGKVAANFGATEARARAETTEQVIRVYRDLVVTSKALHSEIAQRVAATAAATPTVPGVTFERLLAQEASLRALALRRADGSTAAEARRPAGLDEPEPLRDTVVEHPYPDGSTLLLTFRVLDTERELQTLKRKLDVVKQFAETRTAIPGGLQAAFLVVMALAATAAVGFGTFAGRRVTRRIEALVETARNVSRGSHDARVELTGGRDEVAELGSAFNTMLDDLDQARRQVEYLQRIGAWQDVARRLAHEIKNPLTPIQLAVQQTVSSYRGDDARFAKLLADTREIVEEEIASLRRLVDTFRTLGQLPRVEMAPISLAELVEELRLDPSFATGLELRPPAAPVTVRADKLLLKRVLANLIENGLHAATEAGSDGKVVVAWTAGADAVTITVDDAGAGVPDDQREKIFEPYVTSKATGTGLGLAIARKIALEHGGDLVLAPGRAPTGGARFVVSLPLRGAEGTPA